MKNRTHLKVAFDASPLLVNKTGVAYYVERLIVHMAAQYPDVEFVGFYYNFLGRRPTAHFPAAPNIRYRPIRILPSKIIYQLRRWGISPPLELLTKERTDFVLFGNFWGYPSLFNTPAAPVVHDLTYLDLPDYVAAKNRKDLTRMVPEQIARSRFVVTVSQFSKDKIADVYNVADGDVLVTPIPPLPARHHTTEETKTTLQKLGLTKPFILYVGTIEPRKNIIALINAYAALPKKLRDSHTLVIAGRIGWNCDAEVARLEQAKQEGLDVVHLGYVDDLSKDVLFASCTLFCWPCHYEGFGMPILEAMVYERPCAISDIQVFHETAAETGVYFNQTDVSSVSKALQSILADPDNARRIGKAAGKRARTAFSWDKVARTLMERIDTETRQS